MKKAQKEKLNQGIILPIVYRIHISPDVKVDIYTRGERQTRMIFCDLRIYLLE